MTVPSPKTVSILKSSINRFTPGIPAPNPPEVEKPSSITLRTSGIPGPSSDAIIIMPNDPPSDIRSISILPFPAYK